MVNDTQQSSDRTEWSRRTALKTAGAGLLPVGLSGRTVEDTNRSQTSGTANPVEYTLTVVDAAGETVGSVTVTETFDIATLGSKLQFESVGAQPYDGDNAIIDSIAYGDGTMIEGWETRDLSDYTLIKDPGPGNRGEFNYVSSPTAAGSHAVQLLTGENSTTISSDDELVSIDGGTTITGKIRHQTDNSSSLAMRTRVRMGSNAGKRDGITVELSNPGNPSHITAGMELTTPGGNSDRIEFEPTLKAFYTFRLEITSGPRVRFEPTTGMVEVDDTVTYDLVVEGASSGINAYQVTAQVADPGVATVTDAELVAFGGQYSETTIADDGSTVSFKEAVGTASTPDGPFTLGRITLTAGDSEGTTSLEVDEGSELQATDFSYYDPTFDPTAVVVFSHRT